MGDSMKDAVDAAAAEAMRVEVKVTRTSWEDVADAIEDQWDEPRMGGPVSHQAIAVLLGQWHIETDGGVACPNFNMAGIKCVKPKEQKHTYFKTLEGVKGGSAMVVVAGRQPANCFRAWDSLAEGVKGWLDILSGAYRETLPALVGGHGARWAHLIGPQARPGRSWYTGPETNAVGGGYAQALGAFASRYRTWLDRRGHRPKTARVFVGG